MADNTEKMKARLPRGFVDRLPEDIRAAEKMMATIRGVFELYGFEPVDQPLDRIHRCAGQIPARPGPAERGRVLLPGRRRAVAVAALRPDRADGALRGGEFRAAAETLSQLPLRLGVPQREAGAGPLPPVHAVRRRHGRHAGRRGRCRDVHDDGRRDGGAGHHARRLCDPRQQPQGAGRGAGGDRAGRRRECRPPADGAAGDRQAGQVRAGRRAAAARTGPLGRRQGRRGRFYARARGFAKTKQTAGSILVKAIAAFDREHDDERSGTSELDALVHADTSTGEQTTGIDNAPSILGTRN